MAKITLGMWTSHGPTLSTTPQEWLMRVKADQNRPSHPFRLKNYSFDELRDLRRSEDLAEQASLDQRTIRHGRCMTAISKMADIWNDVKPDVAIIMGNDQKEIFNDDFKKKRKRLRTVVNLFCSNTLFSVFYVILDRYFITKRPSVFQIYKLTE